MTESEKFWQATRQYQIWQTEWKTAPLANMLLKALEPFVPASHLYFMSSLIVQWPRGGHQNFSLSATMQDQYETATEASAMS